MIYRFLFADEPEKTKNSEWNLCFPPPLASAFREVEQECCSVFLEQCTLRIYVGIRKQDSLRHRSASDHIQRPCYIIRERRSARIEPAWFQAYSQASLGMKRLELRILSPGYASLCNIQIKLGSSPSVIIQPSHSVPVDAITPRYRKFIDSAQSSLEAELGVQKDRSFRFSESLLLALLGSMDGLLQSIPEFDTYYLDLLNG